MYVFPSWGDPIQQFVFTGGVASVDFLNLGNYRMVLLEMFGISHNAGTPNLEVLISTNNGGTWLGAGEYGRAGVSAGTLSFVVASTTAVTPATYSARIELNNFNQARQSVARINGGRDNNNASTQTSMGFTVNSNILNAVRTQWSTSTNILSGSIYAYGKQ